MKKAMLIAIGVIICLSVCSCKAEQGVSDVDKLGRGEENVISVTVANGVEEADIWILPQTEANLKTTLWGTPTLSKMKVGAEESCGVGNEGTEKYIVRIIDTNGAYYAANDLVLCDGYTVRFETDADKFDARIAVLDENGERVSATENVFEGVL